MTEVSTEERLATLVAEVARSRDIWNLFAGAIIDGFYPGRGNHLGDPFNGSDQDRIEQLFKIRDYEVRRACDVLDNLGFSRIAAPVDWKVLFDELSTATEITPNSHKPL